MFETQQQHRQSRAGAVTVEFAITASLLFMLVMGAIEFSRANMLLHTTTVAATEAVREGIVSGASATEVEAVARQELAFAGIAESTVFVDPATITDDTTLVTVGVSVPVNAANGYLLPQFFLGKNVQKVVSMPREARRDENVSQAIATANADMAALLNTPPTEGGEE